MAQITLADYITLRDSAVTLNGFSNQSIHFDVSLPSTFVKGTSKARPILQFKLYTARDSKIFIGINNQTTFSTVVHKQNHWISWHELLNGSLFNPGETNRILIALQSSESDEDAGEVGISDVVLMFQQKIDI
ncbi:MAG: hypothetical protein ABJM06_09455 [Gilvibacter sp.]